MNRHTFRKSNCHYFSNLLIRDQLLKERICSSKVNHFRKDFLFQRRKQKVDSLCKIFEKPRNLPVLQINRGIRDHYGIIIHIFFIKTYFVTHRDGSNEGSQHMFSLRSMKNYLRIIFNSSSYLELRTLPYTLIVLHEEANINLLPICLNLH